MRRVGGLLGLVGGRVSGDPVGVPHRGGREATGAHIQPEPVRDAHTEPGADTPDFAVALQDNAAHTGAQPGDALQPSLARRWELDFGGALSYPLIADGDVYLVAAGADANGDAGLFALDQRTGRSVWGPVVLPMNPSAPNSAVAAYDGGRVFVLLGDNVLRAYDSHTGALDWSTALPGQSFGETPPVATNGTVYTVGQDVGATVYAVSET